MDDVHFWRMLSRAPRLERSILGVSRVLAGELGVAALQGVIVVRLDLQARAAVLVAEDWLVPMPAARPQSAAWTVSDQDRVLLWHSAGSALCGEVVSEPVLALLWPSNSESCVWAAPLGDDATVRGALLVVAPRAALDAKERQRLESLREPFAVALKKDHEIEALEAAKETLEADRRALLTRLDRDAIVDSVVGADADLAPTMAMVNQVAPTGAPVLIFGETGTGKEVVARAIHARSAYKNGPMVRVNCGAIPPGLVDSELFGHERGSFTGAVTAREGWFERAHGGTLFLDEVGELPLAAQVRLLRVLQEGTLERVGGTRSLRVDVRIVAATHRNLEEMVAKGTFREDLWYRLSVFPIVLPALRERRRDIPELAAHFAARAGKRLGGAPLALSPRDLELLLAYEWPGNVRELAAVIERAAILGNGKSLDVAAALGVRAAQQQNGQAAREAEPVPVLALNAAMRRHIEAVLAMTHGRIEGKRGAAELLEINPHTLRAKMRKLGIDWAKFRGELTQA
jgi:transcriptional regulator with GAF, ATPase, and Fis domain